MRRHLHWVVWFGWVVAAGAVLGLTTWDASRRTACGGWGIGCDPVFVATMGAWVLGPPVVGGGLLTALAARFAPRGAALAAAVACPPLLLAIWYTVLGL